LTADPRREEFEARELKKEWLAAREEEVERMKNRAQIKQTTQAMRSAGILDRLFAGTVVIFVLAGRTRWIGSALWHTWV
jgi:hypothetical protein